MEALRVRFRLASPLAFWPQKAPSPLMLDGILGYVAMRLEGRAKTPAEIVAPIVPDLPLERLGNSGETQYYAASAAFVPETAQRYADAIVRSGTWAKTMRYAGFNMLHNTNNTWTRSYCEALDLLAAKYVDFYCRGDGTRIIRLVSAFTDMGLGLGSKRHIGYGRVRGVSVDPAAEDLSVWRPDGFPSRPVPVAGIEPKDLPVAVTGFRPPYWHADSQALCYVPPESQWTGFSLERAARDFGAFLADYKPEESKNEGKRRKKTA